MVDTTPEDIYLRRESVKGMLGKAQEKTISFNMNIVTHQTERCLPRQIQITKIKIKAGILTRGTIIKDISRQAKLGACLQVKRVDLWMRLLPTQDMGRSMDAVSYLTSTRPMHVPLETNLLLYLPGQN